MEGWLHALQALSLGCCESFAGAMLSCVCFKARPGSPGAELVAKRAGGAAGAGPLHKVGQPDDAENQGENELIGTAVAGPGLAQSEPSAAIEAAAGPGLALEGSAAPLLGAGGGSTQEGGGGGGDGDGADVTASASAADAAADGAVGLSEADASATGADGAAGSSSGAEAAMAAATDAAAAAEAAAAEGSGRHSSPGEEGSQAALLPVEEVSLKQPRMSRLSMLFSCSSSGAAADGGERHSRQQSAAGGDGGSSAAAVGSQGHEELCFESAAAELVLLRRDKLLPLAQPEAALADAAALLGRQEAPVLLSGLLTLRRIAIHHHTLLAGSLEDVVALLLECLHGGGEEVGQAAIMALLDLLVSFGNPMLRYCEQRLVPHHSCLLALLMAASLGRTPAIRAWAEEALSWMALRMHQGRVIALLEPYLEHELPPVRQKAAQHLVVATYRPPDLARPSGSPTRRAQRS